jgi:hypothetical protein
MADIQECVNKLVGVGAITKAIGDEALDMFLRSKAEYSKSMGPASSDAAAALQAAKELRETAAKKQLALAASVNTWRNIERRVIEDPRGGMLGVVGMLSKDTLLGDNRLAALRRENPEHPILRGGSVDSNSAVLRRGFYNMLGPEIAKFKGKGGMANAGSLVDEIFGVDTGNKAAQAVAAGWQKMTHAGVQRELMAGGQLEAREDWRIPQPWNSRRVGKFSEDEFIKDFRAELENGGLKLIDKARPPTAATLFEPARPGFYATPERTDDILKKAYEDISVEGGAAPPFSNQMRTFEFQPGAAGSASWKRLQAKYGTGNEVMSVLDQHIDHMSKTIALHELMGPNPQAAFEAAVRLAKTKNKAEALSPGLRWFDSELVARNTFNEVSGRGAIGPVGNETGARIMSGARALVGAVALRNLPISIVPSDAAMTFLAAHHDGMSGFDVLAHTFAGATTRQEAAHLQLAAHSYQDFIQHSYRRYEDEINVSGIARAIPKAVVRATGANWWTENLRLGYQMSYFHKLADVAELPWERLPTNLRENFLAQYGITPAEWDQIRNIPAHEGPNGAKYVNLPELTQANRELSERLQRAVGERSSYGAHQPDARTRALAYGEARPGTLSGEFRLTAAQYKQFALERMSTHLMRTLYEGTVGERVMRGLAFTLLSTAAGAVSLQTAELLAGKNPHDMKDPAFWGRAFAKGGAGGVYGDLLSDALFGEQGQKSGALAGFLGGPVGGLVGDVTSAALSPFKHELFDEQGRRVTTGWQTDAFRTGKRWTPATWYTKLAVDRLFWDQLQTLLDPHYRESFRRAERTASRRGGGGYWFAPGATQPGQLGY